MRGARELARRADALGYLRYWMAEHHNMPGVASAATAVAIGYVAEATKRIRVGAGGVMLPNHAPLVIAEQFGTLAALYPGRIDLGLGRAPGTDPEAAHALRRALAADPEAFPRDVVELMAYFRPAAEGQRVVAVPGAGLDVPLYILGSSTFGAQLAALLGLPFAFASHFAPQDLEAALALYRDLFRPSPALAEPYVLLGLNIFVAETDPEALRLFTSLQKAFFNLRTGRPAPLPPPAEDLRREIPQAYWGLLDQTRARSVVGAPATVRRELSDFIERHRPDEILATAQIFDPAARVRSFELLAEAYPEGFSVADPAAAGVPCALAPA